MPQMFPFHFLMFFSLFMVMLLMALIKLYWTCFSVNLKYLNFFNISLDTCKLEW